MKIKKCQCDKTASVGEEWEHLYNREKELPFVNHQPNECKCTNELKEYIRRGKRIWLCSCCCMLGDEEIK